MPVTPTPTNLSRNRLDRPAHASPMMAACRSASLVPCACGGGAALEARGEKLVAPTLFGRSNHKKEEAAAGLRNRRNGKVAPAPAEQPGSWMHEERPTKNASSSSSRTGGDPSRETTMQVKVPAGASPGSTIRFQGPGGNTMEIVVPPGVLPGTLLQVNDPFVANNETQVETISD